ncbi:unnamed protein product, partial [Polarella glacialis]
MALRLFLASANVFVLASSSISSESCAAAGHDCSMGVPTSSHAMLQVQVKQKVMKPHLDLDFDSGSDVENITEHRRIAADGHQIGKGSHGEILIWKLTCGQSMKLNASFDMDAVCPKACPYHAENTLVKEFCSSVCVTADKCAHHNPDAPVADDETGACRAARVDGCKVPSKDGTDTCLQCDDFFVMKSDGQCGFKFIYCIIAGVGVLVVLLVVIIYYVWDLNSRSNTNPDGLRRALAFRSSQKYRMQNTSGISGRRLWPLDTNLCKTSIGGPGLLLHFNFQALVIGWGVVVGLGWIVLAFVVDNDLLVLGSRTYGSPYRNCILVSWGHVTQQRLMWTKIVYVSLVYAFTFIGCLAHGLRQQRIFTTLDATTDTMKDFAAVFTGLPPIKGDEKIEDEIRNCVATATGETVVGVSVCWDYGERKEEIMNELEQAMRSKISAVEAIAKSSIE